MIIPFDRHFQRRNHRDQYRKELVDRILDHHREHPNGESEGSMYIEHVKAGFPIYILENIVEKLEKRAGGS